MKASNISELQNSDKQAAFNAAIKAIKEGVFICVEVVDHDYEGGYTHLEISFSKEKRDEFVCPVSFIEKLEIKNNDDELLTLDLAKIKANELKANSNVFFESDDLKVRRMQYEINCFLNSLDSDEG